MKSHGKPCGISDSIRLTKEDETRPSRERILWRLFLWRKPCHTNRSILVPTLVAKNSFLTVNGIVKSIRRLLPSSMNSTAGRKRNDSDMKDRGRRSGK
jgi:hypothetical protein